MWIFCLSVPLPWISKIKINACMCVGEMGAVEETTGLHTYSQIIWSAVWVMLQVKVFKFQFKWAAVAGFQPPVAFGAVVVRHRVVGRSEHASGSREIAPTTYRRKRWDDPYCFLHGKMEFSYPYLTGVMVTLLYCRTKLHLQRVASLCQHPFLFLTKMASLRKYTMEPGHFPLFCPRKQDQLLLIQIFAMLKFSIDSNDKIQLEKTGWEQGSLRIKRLIRLDSSRKNSSLPFTCQWSIPGNWESRPWIKEITLKL